jgi:hypothetical protein
MKANKYSYFLIIQQHYGYGWEDVSSYLCTSNGTAIEPSGKFRETKSGLKIPISLYAHDLAEYRFTGYSTRTICRKESNEKQPINQ